MHALSPWLWLQAVCDFSGYDILSQCYIFCITHLNLHYLISWCIIDRSLIYLCCWWKNGDLRSPFLSCSEWPVLSCSSLDQSSGKQINRAGSGNYTGNCQAGVWDQVDTHSAIASLEETWSQAAARHCCTLYPCHKSWPVWLYSWGKSFVKTIGKLTSTDQSIIKIWFLIVSLEIRIFFPHFVDRNTHIWLKQLIKGNDMSESTFFLAAGVSCNLRSHKAFFQILHGSLEDEGKQVGIYWTGVGSFPVGFLTLKFINPKV